MKSVFFPHASHLCYVTSENRRKLQICKVTKFYDIWTVTRVYGTGKRIWHLPNSRNWTQIKRTQPHLSMSLAALTECMTTNRFRRDDELPHTFFIGTVGIPHYLLFPDEWPFVFIRSEIVSVVCQKLHNRDI